jgi:hypothetical protein
MDPPPSHSAPSGHASLLTLRISRRLFLNVGPWSELTMADPRTQSDEMGAVTVDCAEPDAPGATGVVCPLRVKRGSEPKKLRRPLAALVAPAWGYVCSGGAGEYAAQTWLPKPPRGIGGSRFQHLLRDSG